jgi:hypothetical protein
LPHLVMGRVVDVGSPGLVGNRLALFDQTDLRQLLSKGAELMRAGNVAAARAFFARLAERRSAKGAFALARSFDPAVLAELPLAGGPEPDAGMASFWYEEAVRLAH